MAVAEHKIDDLCGGGQRPGAGIQQVERRDRVEVGEDRVDPRNAEYAGPQNYDDRRPYRLAEAGLTAGPSDSGAVSADLTEVDALSGATITSSAVTTIVNNSYFYVTEVLRAE